MIFHQIGLKGELIMGEDSRLTNSIRNSICGLTGHLISILTSFIVRTIFIKQLGNQYLSVNGLFSNILTMLSLAELGVGTAIIYSLYRLIANRDEKKIKAIMNLYKKVYMIIGILVAVMGLLIVPFIDSITHNQRINNVLLIYILFLGDSVLSYFWSYKRSILLADQKEYISVKYKYIFTIVKSLCQVFVLIVTKSFICFLIVQVISNVVENIVVSRKVDSMYPFLKEKKKEELGSLEKKSLYENTKALLITRIGHVMLNGTDNIIITMFVGISEVGVLSNYVLIINTLSIVVSYLFSGMLGSIGNFIAKENKKRQYELFKTIDFINFLIYGIVSVSLFFNINSLIEVWLGNSYLLSKSCSIVIVINFYISGITNVLWMFRSTMGLFTQGKYRPIITAVLNIILSIGLAEKIGVTGVLLGTTISRLLVNLWYDPYIIFKFGFGESVKEYYFSHIKYWFYILLDSAIIFAFSNFISTNNIYVMIIVEVILCTLVFLTIFIVTNHNRNEYIYIKQRLKILSIELSRKIKYYI